MKIFSLGIVLALFHWFVTATAVDVVSVDVDDKLETSEAIEETSIDVDLSLDLDADGDVCALLVIQNIVKDQDYPDDADLTWSTSNGKWTGDNAGDIVVSVKLSETSDDKIDFKYDWEPTKNNPYDVYRLTWWLDQSACPDGVTLNTVLTSSTTLDGTPANAAVIRDSDSLIYLDIELKTAIGVPPGGPGVGFEGRPETCERSFRIFQYLLCLWRNRG
jgi:hypothetical protein